LQDVLPIDEPLHAVTIRNHVFTLAQRLKDSLGEEQDCSIEGCPRDWGRLPIPDGPLAEHLLDWFHLTMRLTTMTQTAKGLPAMMGGEEEVLPLRDEVIRQLERVQ
jgi:hypothetical protein